MEADREPLLQNLMDAFEVLMKKVDDLVAQNTSLSNQVRHYQYATEVSDCPIDLL